MSSARIERARLAALTRHHPGNDLSDVRRDLAAEKLAAYIQRTIEAAPPLTSAQRDKLTLLLNGAPAARDAAA